MTRRSAGEGLIRQRSNGTWEARYVAADGRKRSLYAKTQREATDRLRGALGDAQHGLPVLDKRLTTGAYLIDWLEHEVKPNRRLATYRAYEQMVRIYLIPGLGRIPLAKLAPEHVQAMLAHIDANPPTLRYCRTVLRIALTRAERHGRALRNAAALVDAPEAPRKVVESFTATEARTLIEALDGHDLVPLILTALGTGARQGELLALRWQDIDLDDATVRIRHTLQGDGTLAPPKTEASIRDTTLPRFVVDALRAHRREQLRQRLAAGPKWHDGDFVFARRDGRPLLPNGVRSRYAAVLKDAGLPHRPFHSLRHAFASLQHEGGEDMATISKLLGHSSISTTMDIYAHLSPKTQRRAAERMDRVLTG